jgi:hypothetical protein
MRLDRGFLCAAFLLFALSFPSNILAQGGQQTAASDPTSSIAAQGQTNRSGASAAIEESASAELPDSPGALLAQQQDTSQQQVAPPQGNTNSQAPAATSSQASTTQSGTPAPQNEQAKPQRPVGTAAAEAPMVSGVTAAQPAGIAVAPGKQHRVRTLVIKVGAIAGAAVAIGATMALTMGTPSKPPGAH